MASEARNGSGDAERLSALVDGELDAAAAEEACARWKADAETRCSWHAYQLIGDVLRSDGLAKGASGNEQFLVSLRARLKMEPIVFAPAPLSAPQGSASRRPAISSLRTSRWLLPSAMAAGLLLVVGTFTVLRPGGLPSIGASPVTVAEATVPPSGAAPLESASIRESMGGPMPVMMDGKVIRDARLDRYLAAHKQFSGSSALGLPSAFLRSATVESDAR
jgi:sigma-E factor negative regulatory protein RseA